MQIAKHQLHSIKYSNFSIYTQANRINDLSSEYLK